MKFTRRTLLQFTGFSVMATALLPRMAFAARNTLRSLRTGIQPANKTRLVIETATRPSYSLSYPSGQLVITIANTTANTGISASLASGGLVKSIAQAQNGDALQIIATLRKPIAQIPKSSIMILEPNGDNDYRLVLDFVAGQANATADTSYTTSSAATTTAVTAARKYIVVVDAGHGGKDPGCIGKGGTREKDIVLSVAKKLKSKLDANGFKTYLTRSDDTYLKLARRAEIAEQRKADLFISLHANANPSRKMKGFSIYTLSEKASDEEAKNWPRPKMPPIKSVSKALPSSKKISALHCHRCSNTPLPKCPKNMPTAAPRHSSAQISNNRPAPTFAMRHLRYCDQPSLGHCWNWGTCRTPPKKNCLKHPSIRTNWSTPL